MTLALFLFAIVFVLLVLFGAWPLSVYLSTHDTRPEKEPYQWPEIRMVETPEFLYQLLHFVQFGWNEWTEALNKKWRRV